MQLADLLIGAVAYKNRSFESSLARIRLRNNLISNRAKHELTTNTKYNAIKFNIFKMESSDEQ